MDVRLILVAVLAALIILALLRVLVTRRRRLPYRRRDHLLTAAELSFYGVLSRVVEGRFQVAWKVRMADVLWVPGGTADRQRHLNRILAKHLDFVLCHPGSSAPVLAIELDDSSHGERHWYNAERRSQLPPAGRPLRLPTPSRLTAARPSRTIAPSVKARTPHRGDERWTYASFS